MAKRKMLQGRIDLGGYPLDGSLAHARDCIQGYIEQYGENAVLGLDIDYGYGDHDETHSWYIRYEREETDAEMHTRLERNRKALEKKRVADAKRKAKLEEKERAELSRLLAKYSEKE